MLICPLCGANDIKEQPEPSLHAFTTIFECGTKIDQAFNASDWTYAQKCNEPIIKYHLDLLSKPDTLIPIYANQRIPTHAPKSILLIGPTYYPNRNIDSWRTTFLNYLKNKDFKGYVFIPEIENSYETDLTYNNHLEWEEYALKKAGIIIFWLPNELENLDIEYLKLGYLLAKVPEKLILVNMDNSRDNHYLKYYCDNLNISQCLSLEETLNMVMEKLK